LQTVPYLCRWILTPQGVDQLFSGNHAAGLQSQHGEQGTQLRSRDNDVSFLIIEDLESTEQSDAHGSRYR
jgi:hypothetical protein